MSRDTRRKPKKSSRDQSYAPCEKRGGIALGEKRRYKPGSRGLRAKDKTIEKGVKFLEWAGIAIKKD